jgi:hypothetical protein
MGIEPGGRGGAIARAGRMASRVLRREFTKCAFPSIKVKDMQDSSW